MERILEKTINKIEITLKEVHKEYDDLNKMKEYNQEYRRWLEGNIYAYVNILEYVYKKRADEAWDRTS